MNKKPIILGIKSSCDETAASIVLKMNRNTNNFIKHYISQFEVHKKFGGVVPELAAELI